MLYLIQYHWIWLFLAATLGIGIGWSTCAERRGEGLRGWLMPTGVLFGLGAVAALFRIVPGRFGYWLDMALLSFAAYLAGCCIGCLARERSRRHAAAPADAAGGLGDRPRPPGNNSAKPLATMPSPGAGSDPTSTAKEIPVRPGSEAASETASRPTVELEPGLGRAANGHPGRRPLGLSAPREGSPEDLKRIRGIGPQNERRLNALGIWHYDQIATWTGENIVWVASFLKFPGRIDRENWVAQAKILASGGTTEFARRVDAGKVPTSRNGQDDSGGRG
jgi:predicted flap endonuclease-1-like 5' DNA nuclease